TIEGAAESTAALLKLASGWWSDRIRRRKPLVLLGYVIASSMRPLVAIARSASQVLVVRVSDRVGKGIRNSPRDALIAESVDPSIRGKAFGFHRAGDNAGGVVGPLLAFALLQWWAFQMRTVFWLALIPGILATVTVIAFVQERPRPPNERQIRREAPAENAVRGGAASENRLPPSFWAYLGILLVFTLG